MNLAAQPWPAVPSGALLAVPVGSTEQHGPHLPLSTDTDIATALAARLASTRPDVVVAPPVAYGASGEHAGFAGTLSIGTAALTMTLVELIRSADHFAGVILVNAHGGNAEAIGSAVATLRAEGRRVLSWSPPGGGDAHAGRTETSLMLAIAPSSVDVDAAVAGDTRPIGELIGALRSHGVAPISPTGVLGDPAGASAGEGAALLDAWGTALAAAVAAWAAA